MKRKLFFSMIGTLLVLLFIVGSPLSADDDNAYVQPNVVEQGGVEVDSQRYSYGHYLATAHIEDSINPFSFKQLDQWMLGMANITFDMTKMVAQLVDAGIDQLISVNVVNTFADDIGSASEEMYNQLYDHFAALFLTITVLFAFFMYYTQKSAQQAGNLLLKFVLTLGLAAVWFSQADEALKGVNNLASEGQSVIMAAGSPLTDETIDGGDHLEGSQALMRNAYFDKAVYTPYLIMNYGTTNEEELLEDDPERIDNLVSAKLNEDGMEERESVAETEANELNNTAMTQIMSKIGVAFLSLIFAVLLGVPLLLIAMVNFFVQIIVLLLAVFLPISFIIGMIPGFSNSGYYTLGRLVGAAMMKMFIGILILLTYLVINIVDSLFPADSLSNYMLGTTTLAVVLILMIKYRNKIMEFSTGGRMTQVDMGTGKQAYHQGVRKPAQAVTGVAKKGAAVAGSAASAGTGVVVAGTVQKAQERMANRKQQRQEQSSEAVKDRGQDTKEQSIGFVQKHERQSQGRSSQNNQSARTPQGTVVDMKSYKNQDQRRGKQASTASKGADSVNEKEQLSPAVTGQTTSNEKQALHPAAASSSSAQKKLNNKRPKHSQTDIDSSTSKRPSIGEESLRKKQETSQPARQHSSGSRDKYSSTVPSQREERRRIQEMRTDSQSLSPQNRTNLSANVDDWKNRNTSISNRALTKDDRTMRTEQMKERSERYVPVYSRTSTMTSSTPAKRAKVTTDRTSLQEKRIHVPSAKETRPQQQLHIKQVQERSANYVPVEGRTARVQQATGSQSSPRTDRSMQRHKLNPKRTSNYRHANMVQRQRTSQQASKRPRS